ncbi:MAG: recombinase family protein [Peptostreptococcaceae bacterium]|nr:recombinase family protein [Peptostreptococcaceae bacterium]
MIYGYHRISSIDQHLERGIASIKEYCSKNGLQVRHIYRDKQTGKNFDRPDYQEMKTVALRSGDWLILSELDRLGRDKNSTLDELRWYKENNIRVMILEIPTTLFDYSSLGDSLATMLMETVNNMLIEMYATISHAEMQKRVKRQREGFEQKRLRGEWHEVGRPAAISTAAFAIAYKRIEAGEIGPFALIRELGLTKPTFYRYRAKYIGNSKQKK